MVADGNRPRAYLQRTSSCCVKLVLPARLMRFVEGSLQKMSRSDQVEDFIEVLARYARIRERLAATRLRHLDDARPLGARPARPTA